MKKHLFLFLVFSSLTGVIIANERVETNAFAARIAKWYGNRDAAISLTYDDGDFASKNNRRVNRYAEQHEVTLDYEIITENFPKNSFARDQLKREFIFTALGYFGHGHRHVSHDGLSYQEALASFSLCFQTMSNLGLKPVAYAYPHGKGFNKETRQALAASGFLSGRLHISPQMNEPYIVPDNELEPQDWFALPCLVMQDYSFQHCDRCISNNEQLQPYLEHTLTKKAWLILAYHAIGDPKGYGFYAWEEFKKDILEIKKRHFWVASMNQVTLYIRERQHATVKMHARANTNPPEIEITVADGLPNRIYNQPLTVLFNLPEGWVNESILLLKGERVLRQRRFYQSQAAISLPPDETPYRLRLNKK